MIGTISAGVYFVFDLIVQHFLPHYTISLQFILISLISLPFLMVINIIIINLYKAKKLEKRYFKMLVYVLGFSLIIHFSLFMLFHSLHAIMYGTLITYITWYLYTTMIEFPFLKMTWNELVLLSSFIGVYFLTTTYFSPILGAVIYFIVLIGLVLILFKQTIRYAVDKLELQRFSKKKLIKMSS